MGNECSKAVLRRIHQQGFVAKYFVGHGIDIGAGSDLAGNSDGLGRYTQQFPRMLSCRGWDMEHGDAQYMSGLANESFDFVHSSHCLEHMRDPHVAIQNWFRLIVPGGHLIITVPDEDLYEQGGNIVNGNFHSCYNSDHKMSITIFKHASWSPNSINVFDLIKSLGPEAKTIKVELQDGTYQYDMPKYDQTLGTAECSIEFIVQRIKFTEHDS